MSAPVVRELLPTQVKPIKYSVQLKPDLVTTFKTAGYEEITLDVKDTTSEITVHSREITISKVDVVQESNTIESTNITFDEKKQMVTFKFAQPITAGKPATLRITFESTLNDSMAGFYRSKYTLNGEDRWMGTTQFEATDARRAFPCWDEPAVKAIFEIILIVPTNRVALSNMLPVDEKVDEASNLKTIKFDVSPVMSTYLVAWVVGEFDYVEDTSDKGVRVRVYTPVNKKELGTFALGVATKTLSYFTDYFSIPYPLPKMDMIAIADFSAGAMENWGLVTYRETALLVDEKNSPVSTRQRVAYVVAHELAHQWFGNLVTMEWWNNLWLNEGFATFVGNLATDFLFPKWDIWTVFVNDYQATAFSLDALANSHPIEVDVATSDQISEIFDAISYNKGSCVIRMLEAYLGQDNFKKGLHKYLTKFQYNNAVTEDLWSALGAEAKIDVNQFMGSFTKNVGYPVVTVERGSDPETLKVTQSRFLSSGAKHEDPTVWSLALTMASAGTMKSPVQEVVSEKSATIKFPFKKDEWVKINYGQPGFYRVKYSPEMLELLYAPLKDLLLPPVDRLGVQGDVFALARSGELPTSQFLDIALSMKEEVDYTVWNALTANIGTLAGVWKQEPVAPKLKDFALEVYGPIFSKLGWDAKSGESAGNTLLRSIVLRALGTRGHEAIVAEAKKRFEAYLKDRSTLVSDIKSAVFEIVCANGDASTLDQMISLYREATASEDKTRILGVMTNQPTEELARKALDWTLQGEVRDQDLYLAFYPIQNTPFGIELCWTYLQEKWDVYHKRLGGGGLSILTRIIQKSTEGFTNVEKTKEIQNFFATHPYPAADRTVKQSIETINARAKWLNASREDVAKWADSRKK